MSTFRLPDLGEGLAEAEIVEWHVKVGDHVRVDQPMLSVETAKAVVEVPAPFSGIVTALRGAPGDITPPRHPPPLPPAALTSRGRRGRGASGGGRGRGGLRRGGWWCVTEPL